MLLIPLIFTAIKLGWFSPEPTIVTKIKADKNAPVLRIVGDKNFNPRSYINNNGEWAGSDVEVAIEVSNRLGMRPEFVFTDWLTARNVIAEGEADLLLGLEVFSNMKDMDKSIPILNGKFKIYGKRKTKDAASLSGKRVGLIGKSVFRSLFPFNCTYIEYFNYENLLQALDRGDIDYAICHESVADTLIYEQGLVLKKGFALIQSFPAFGIRKDKADFKEKLNNVLVSMAEDGTLQKLTNKWLARNKGQTIKKVFSNNSEIYLLYLLFFFVCETMFGIYILQERNHRKELLLIESSNTDAITKLLNRRAYENAIASYKVTELPKNLVYVAIDLNGLKQINDTKGHVAGDELIIGAAKCLKQSFGPYGTVYRVGGDEFVAILFSEGKELERIKKTFEKATSEWKGLLAGKLSVSCGYVQSSEGIQDIMEMAILADERMYTAKSEYYKNKDIDRRSKRSKA